jgi:ribosomal protein S18 acetylase RimI-like enzyme
MARVRDAVEADVARLAEIHVRSWQAVYRGIFPDEFLDNLSIERRTEGWRQFIRGVDERSAALVVVEEEEPLGFSRIGCAEGSPSKGEIYAIYLDPDHWDRGLGRMLMLASEDRLRAMGFTQAELWVLEANQRARRFYEAAGWSTDGALKVEEIGGVSPTQVRYRREL